MLKNDCSITQICHLSQKEIAKILKTHQIQLTAIYSKGDNLVISCKMLDSNLGNNKSELTINMFEIFTYSYGTCGGACVEQHRWIPHLALETANLQAINIIQTEKDC